MFKINGISLMDLEPVDYDFWVKGEGQDALHVFDIESDLYNKLLSVAKNSEMSLYVLLFATLKMELSRLSGNKAVYISSPCMQVLGFSRKEGQTEVLVLGEINNELTFRQLLQKTSEEIITANQNSFDPFDCEITEEECERLNALDSIHLSLNTLACDGGVKKKKFRLFFDFVHEQDNLKLCLRYDRGFVAESKVADLFNMYICLLQQAIYSPDEALQNYELLSEDEIKILFNQNDNFDAGNDSADKLFESVAQIYSDKRAVYYNGKYLTYEELNEKANQLAHVIVEKGVVENDLVGIMLDNSHEMIISILAVMKCKAGYLPISPIYPNERVMSIVKDSNIRLLISDSVLLDGHVCSEIIGAVADEKQIYVTPTRQQIKDIDRVQIPDRSYVDYEKYVCHIGQSMVKNSITLQFSRGCMFKCAYCFKIWPDEYVIRSAENIFGEMKLYYDMGIRRFGFVDDLPNFNIEVSSKLYQMIIDNNMKVQLHYPNGIRGDVLTKEYIDLMIKAGTVNMDLALETTSLRLQKLIRKHLNVQRLKENIEYITTKYPHVVLQLQMLIGIPSETEEESLASLEFIKSIKWIDFPYIHILKIFPNTTMAKIAVENGVSEQAIEDSASLAYHELPTTLPFPVEFAKEVQTEFLNEYFLSKERLMNVIPKQLKIFTKEEVVQAYNGYLPNEINGFDDLLNVLGISADELDLEGILPEDYGKVEGLDQKIREHFGTKTYREDALRVLFLDATQYFSDKKNQQYDVYEPPLGLMYLVTSVHRKFGDRINAKIVKSRMDFDSFDELRSILDDFKPDVVSIRSMNYYSNFFHMLVEVIRLWGFKGPLITGGPYGTSSYNTLLRDENVDMVLIGEGEDTITDVMQVILDNGGKLPDDLNEMKDIPGLAYRNYSNCSVKLLPVDILSESINRRPVNNPNLWGTMDRTAYVIYTSGSTGKPKGVRVLQRNLVNQIKSFILRSNLKNESNFILLADFTFDVSIMHIFLSLLTGGMLHLVSDDDKKTPYKLWETVKDKHIDILNTTPTYMDVLLSELDSNEKLKIEYLLIGGEAFKKNLYDRICEKVDAKHIYNMYGPTETTINATLFECSDDEDGLMMPIGKPLPNYTAYILDKNLKLLPNGFKGDLYIGGKGVTAGYINDMNKTKKSFIPNPYCPDETIYKTGDIAFFRNDGNIVFVGRDDYQVKVRGFRIELEEIEYQLLRYSGIKDAVVTVREDLSNNSVLYAYVVADGKIDIETIKRFLSRKLPHYMVPTYIIEIDSLPYTLNGKVDFKQLPLFSEIFEMDGGRDEYDEVEETIAGIWTEILKVENIRLSDNFFNLGGHSLNAAVCVSRVKKEFAVDITIKQLFLYPTLREFCNYIRSLKRDSCIDIEPAPIKDKYPVSNAQLQILLAARLDATKLTYNVSTAFRVIGSIDNDKLQKTFNMLLAQNEILRTFFELTDKGYVQKVNAIDSSDIEFETSDANEQDLLLEKHNMVFDLGKAPLIKLSCIRMKDNSSILWFHLHHVVCDGSSLAVLFDEFACNYNGGVVANKALQYKDYCEWINSDKKQAEIKKHEKYWSSRIEGYNSKGELPLDYSRGSKRDFSGALYSFEMVGSELIGLDQLLQKYNITKYMFFLSIYYILISKLSNEKDIIVGTPVSVRSNSKLERMCGVFLNMLPMRNVVEEDKCYIDFLMEIKENVLSDFEHQEYPYISIVNCVNKENQSNRNGLFNLCFDMSNYEALKLKLNGLEVERIEIPYNTSKYDCTLLVAEAADGMKFSFEYAKILFSQDTMKYYASSYVDIVKAVLENTDILLSELCYEEAISIEEDDYLNELDDIEF